jgi:hypothetical protein
MYTIRPNKKLHDLKQHPFFWYSTNEGKNKTWPNIENTMSKAETYLTNAVDSWYWGDLCREPAETQTELAGYPAFWQKA